MRALFLTSRMPYPPERGDRFRVYHFIRAASLAGHEIHLVTFDTGAHDPAAIEPLSRHLASIRIVRLPAAISALRAAAAACGARPFQVAYYESRRMSAAVGEAYARVAPDLLYTHLFRMAPYSPRSTRERPATRVLDLTDVISTEIRRSLPFRRRLDRWLHAEEARRIERYERLVATRFDECWVISQEESRRLSALAPGARIRVVPNGLDPAEDGPAPRRTPGRLLFLGNHRVAHNRDAARVLVRDVFPLVRANVPEATLDLAGKDSKTLGRWTRAEGVRVVGYVPRLRDAMEGAAVFVAPHRFAAGVQNKVIQALAAGTPVVTTPIVREGLDPAPADLLRVGVTPEELAAHVIALLRHPAEAAAEGARGRAWARARFRWETATRAFESAAKGGTDLERPPRGTVLA